jgi:hypothetical protein
MDPSKTSRVLALIIPLFLASFGVATDSPSFLTQLIVWLGLDENADLSLWDNPTIYVRGSADEGEKFDSFQSSEVPYEDGTFDDPWDTMVWKQGDSVFLTTEPSKRIDGQTVRGRGVPFHVLDKVYPEEKTDYRHTVRDRSGNVQVLNLLIRGNLGAILWTVGRSRC